MMTKNQWVGREHHRVRVNEIDHTRCATLQALVNLIQEAAWNNSANLKYSVYDLMEQGVTWVVYRMQISIHRYPQQQEELEVMSWPSGMDRLYTYRDYRILDSNGIEVLRATSAWLVMDIKKRELVSVPTFIRKGLDFSQEYERLELDRTKLKPVENPTRITNASVSMFDMDVNEHVYNTHYFKWILEGMTDLLQQGSKVEYIDIQFKGEGRLGDRLLVNQEKISSNQFRHQILNQESGDELIRALTKWSSA